MNNKKLNNKGFTLIELLAAVVIIAILSIILLPNTMKTLQNGTNTGYNIFVKNIREASILLFEELEYTNSSLYYYDLTNGQTNNQIKLNKDKNNVTLTVNIQTIVSNGFLKASHNYDYSTNQNNLILINPKTKKDVGDCEIIITKTKTKNNKVNYMLKNNSLNNKNCPTDKDYEKNT